MVDFKKVGAVVASGVVVFGLGGLSGALLFPTEVTETVTETEYVEVVKEVPVVEYVNQTVEVPVDNGNLDAVLEHVYEYGVGDLDLNDLDDDEVDEIVDRVVFLNDAREIARQHVRADFDDIVHRRDVGNIEVDGDDVERVRVGDVEDFTVENVDFDYEDARVLVPVEFEVDGDEYDVVVEVEIRNGEVDDADLE